MIVESTRKNTHPIPGTDGGEYVGILTLLNRERIEIGARVAFNMGCFLNGAGGIEIGDDVKFGPYCCIHSANHVCDPQDAGALEEWDERPVRIGARSWFGCNVIVVPGAEVGEGATIGGGAVVAGIIPAGATAVGVPAQVVG